MKHLKPFKVFEAVIIPQKLENDFVINSFEDLVEYGNQNDFDVVEYDEFYDSLGEADKKTAPPRGVPFFALFNPIRKKAMFVICDRNTIRRIPNFKEIVNDIIGHEKVHAEQTIRRDNIEFALPSPTDQKAYFSNKEEIMAFSWTISNDLSKKSQTVEDAIDRLDREFSRDQWCQIWSSIKRVCDENVIKRYRKYIYMYLDETISKRGEENIHTKISRR